MDRQLPKPFAISIQNTFAPFTLVLVMLLTVIGLGLLMIPLPTDRNLDEFRGGLTLCDHCSWRTPDGTRGVRLALLFFVLAGPVGALVGAMMVWLSRRRSPRVPLHQLQGLARLALRIQFSSCALCAGIAVVLTIVSLFASERFWPVVTALVFTGLAALGLVGALEWLALLNRMAPAAPVVSIRAEE
jgi:hypothetical protein